MASQVFLVLSPNLLQAADYTTIARVIHFSGLTGKSKVLRPRTITYGFIAADVFALLVQAVGITIWASSKGSGKPDSKAISLGRGYYDVIFSFPF